jgi:hypothetical protein
MRRGGPRPGHHLGSCPILRMYAFTQLVRMIATYLPVVQPLHPSRIHARPICSPCLRRLRMAPRALRAGQG